MHSNKSILLCTIKRKRVIKKYSIHFENSLQLLGRSLGTFLYSASTVQPEIPTAKKPNFKVP